MGRKKNWPGSKNENWLGVNNKYENRQRYINGLILPVHQQLLHRKCRPCSLAPSTSRQQSQKSALSSTIQSSKGRHWGSSSISLSIIIETLLWIFPLSSLFCFDFAFMFVLVPPLICCNLHSATYTLTLPASVHHFPLLDRYYLVLYWIVPISPYNITTYQMNPPCFISCFSKFDSYLR